MAMELACGNCQGRLLVETPGVIVACPHCGIHLQTPAAPPAPSVELAAPPFVTTSAPAQPSAAPEFQNSEVTLQMPATFDAPEQQQPVHGATETLWQPAELPAPGGGETLAPAWEAPAMDENTLHWPEPQPDVPAPAWLAPEEASPFSFASGPATESQFPDFSAPAGDRTEALMTQASVEQQAVAPSLPREVAEVQPPAPSGPPDFVQPEPAADTPTVMIPQTENFVQETSPFGAAELAPTMGLAPTMPEFPPTIQEFPPTVPDFSPVATASPAADAFTQPLAPPPQHSPALVSAAATAALPEAMFAPGLATGLGSAKDSSGTASPPLIVGDSDYRPRSGLSPQAAKMLLSYASAMTLACAYLLYLLWSGSMVRHKLESLPDLAPPRDKNNPDRTLSLIHVQVDVPMAPFHTLRLGDSERFGSVRITPLRVTKEMLEFTHYDPTSKETKAAVGPVLKLYLQVENVSSDQTFSPFDRQLIFSREQKMGKNKRPTDLWLSNNWVCQIDEKKKDGNLLLVYDLPNGSWDLKGQDIERELKPGESFTTYIPTAPDDIDSFTGSLIWRVHFRKGYNPQSHRGVTTLIEVEFDSDEIENTTQVAAPAASPADNSPAKQNA